jgi:BirA family biotin operon repressor/biotin-[acetyl-CoA-carboxylase] ligase
VPAEPIGCPPWRIIHHQTLDSTNLEALRLAQQGAEAGTVVAADTQTAGRGRLGRKWADASGSCLLMTVLVHPPAHCAGLLGAAMALAAAEATSALTGASPAIKWPNDLLLGGRKMAGILAEGPRNGLIAVGIGVNVNGDPDDLPYGLRETATFISHEAGHHIDLHAFRQSLLDRLGAYLQALDEGQSAGVVEGVRRFDCLAGRAIHAQAGSTLVEGIALGWLDDGRLAVRDAAGNETALDGGEVTLI